ncbi:MAG: hypothetical protein K2H53_01940, partial [Clostridia bacterium]|nr:hypothetical protein [Clostridia bacterium]
IIYTLLRKGVEGFMAKQKKKRQQSNRYSLLECEIRTVTKSKSDSWCKRKMPKGLIPAGDAPWGYVITIPYCPNQNIFLDDVDGYIVRTKMHCGNLLLQVIKKDSAPEYGVKSAAKLEPNVSSEKRKNKKKMYRVLSIKNLNKSKGKWGRAIW